MIMIAVGNDNLMNTSYQLGTATLDVSEYSSNDSIEIKMYGINKCGMMSTFYTNKTIKLGE